VLRLNARDRHATKRPGGILIAANDYNSLAAKKLSSPLNRCQIFNRAKVDVPISERGIYAASLLKVIGR
jgi:hypothetical protein